MKRLILLLLPLLAAAPAAGPRPEFAGLYRPAGPRLLLDTRREGDSLRLLLHQTDGGAVGAEGRPVRLTAWAGYDARAPLWQINLPGLRRHAAAPETGSAAWAEGCVAAAQVPAGTVLQVETAAAAEPGAFQDGSTTAWRRLRAADLNRSFVLTDSVGVPLGRRYLRPNEPFGVAEFGLELPIRWRRYAATATAALPPFAGPGSRPQVPRTLAVLDSAAEPAGTQLRLPEPGLYTLRADAEARPLAVLVAAAPDFPGQSQARELIESLLYLTTSQERQQLTNAPDPKRAVDRFWLDAARGDQRRGRELIRTYYGRVQAANELFTAHKPGWLTDQGLLYVVLGPPAGVRRLATGEERWFYRAPAPGFGPVTFSFQPKPSTFAPDYHELVRRPEYEALWYAAVEQWRTGTTAPTDR
ncbi:GWxTD domain-containing protein [uncultured Hymenobacter sp.]|uniref:GWxTD domain-containing protein n=1 Tax=uncultured Hymenobacter sp. TaxID=170016 RepID=UPI0035CA14CA